MGIFWNVLTNAKSETVGPESLVAETHPEAVKLAELRVVAVDPKNEKKTTYKLFPSKSLAGMFVAEENKKREAAAPKEKPKSKKK